MTSVAMNIPGSTRAGWPGLRSPRTSKVDRFPSASRSPWAVAVKRITCVPGSISLSVRSRPSAPNGLAKLGGGQASKKRRHPDREHATADGDDGADLDGGKRTHGL